MHFTSGRHLANYLLKIFKNNEIDISEDCIDSIKDLSKIFTYIENLPKDTKNILDLSNEYHNWITLSQNGKYQDLSSISNKGNENIAKFTNNPSVISFDEVFESFGLNISYNSHYLHQKPKQDDIYYPHHFKILEGTHKMAKWNITFYDKPTIPKEENFGCYFIYDNNNQLVYIGKSNLHLLERACESARERTNGDFSKIELYPMKTQADTNIYELYYIAQYDPKYNSDCRCLDKPSFTLPKQYPKYSVNQVGTETFDVEQIFISPKYIPVEEYWKEPQKYYLQVGEKINMEHFYQFHSQNKHGIINVEEFRNRVTELQNKGYLTYVYKDNGDCFRQFSNF